jgi:hypothetical protein
MPGNLRTIEFINFLFEEYSRRDLSQDTDRCVAVSGLVDRIAKALQCKSRYGIFETFRHRNLLWQASDNEMESIAYDDDQQVPSWSWMAYSGGIQFMEIKADSVGWVDTLQLDKDCKSALITDVGKFQNCTIKPNGDHSAVLNFSEKRRGWIRYDVEKTEKHRREYCVVVGKTTERGSELYYVLVVVPTSMNIEYTRVGIGMIHCGHVKRWKKDVRVV